MKRVGCLLAVILCLALVLLAAYSRPLWHFRTRLTQTGSGIAVSPPPQPFAPAPLPALPTYDYTAMDAPLQVDLRARDLRALDLQSRLEDLLMANFDTNTSWPAALPEGFDPEAILQTGKNPGLGLRALHARGITGRGVGVAIIDQNLLVNHVEYADRLRLYEEIHYSPGPASMHGPAVASLAVGGTVGVAPEADLYFIGEWHGRFSPLTALLRRQKMHTFDFTPTAQSIRRLLEINRQLPQDRKIRVISISVGWSPYRPGYDEVTAAAAQAEREGIFVISTGLERTHGFSFHGLGRDPRDDPDQLSSYTESCWDNYYLDQHPGRPPLLVPMDSRTLAAPTGPTDYAFSRTGGWSWAVPYLAGLYALACQVNPDVTPDQFWETALQTGDIVDLQGRQIPDPDGSLAAWIAKTLDQLVLDYQQIAQGEELERHFARYYAGHEGVSRDRMTEAEFRAWYTNMWITSVLGDGQPHQLGRIVNPTRLIEALRPPPPPQHQ